MKIRKRVLMAAMMVALSAASAQGQGAVARPTAGGGGGGTVTGGARAGAIGGGGSGPSGASAGYTCEVGEQLANLGIGTFHCQGGDCRVAGMFSMQVTTFELPERPTSVAALQQATTFRSGNPENPDQKDWSFTVEPSLWDIHLNGPAAGKVKEGDYLVAVNGVPVTTPNAAFVLGNMVAGRPINLTLRRGDAIVPAQIFPTAGCLNWGVSSGTSDLPRTLIRDESGRIVRRSDGTVIVP